jgi:hypothetical protein
VAEGDYRILDVANLAIFVGLAYLSTLARRNMSLFVLGAGPIVALGLATLRPWVERASASWRASWSAQRPLWTATATLVLIPAMLVTGWLVATNRFYRWDGQIFEFGTGILEVSAPVHASAFAREQRLPPPLFNDMTSGGYLTWDRPVDERVYIDGRLEVYDAFFARYLTLMAQPAQWQLEAERVGFQTVILLHTWSAHRPVLSLLLRDPRWATVYFDEAAIVFLRRAGNEAYLETSRAVFESRRARREGALLDHVESWQWPAGRARGLVGYGNLLDAMGKPGEAVPFFARALEIGAPRNLEVGVALRLVQHHLARGDRDRARDYLNQAAAADPTNPSVARWRSQIGQ